MLVTTCQNILILKEQQKLWKVKMRGNNLAFYNNQCLIPLVGYCSKFVNRNWQIQSNRNVKTKRRCFGKIKCNLSVSVGIIVLSLFV